MCTCMTYNNGDFYFGRNLDLDCSFGETVLITPRNFPLDFRHMETADRHYAMIGMASETPAFPLYAEAVNEKGLAMAGLNFPGSACYGKAAESGADELKLASFEMIAWFLGNCASVDEAAAYLKRLKVVDTAFAEQMPPAPLHWMMADRERCLVIEQVRDGLKVYENPVGVLTNNPPFDFHLMNLNNYINLSAENPKKGFADGISLRPFAQGMGAVGLPGDASSVSRFVRAAFLKWNSVSEPAEEANVSQFFHILDGVAMVRGSVVTDRGTYDITTYSCCINAKTGTYYYKTYDDSRIRKAVLYDADLDSRELIME